MGVPVPALLAGIALLLWPAGRLCAALSAGYWTRRPAAHGPQLSLFDGYRRQLITASIFAAHAVLFALAIGLIGLLVFTTHRMFGAHELHIFDSFSLDSLFGFAMLGEFAAFTFLSAFDTHKAMHEQTVSETIGGPVAIGRPFELLTAARRLRAELPVYVSTAAAAFVIFLILAGVSAFVGSSGRISSG